MSAIFGISHLAQATEAAAADAAFRERVELAKADVESEFAELNAQTLVAMLSALDALVEALVPRAREMLIESVVGTALRRAEKEVPDAASAISEEQMETVRLAALEVLGNVIEQDLGEIRRAAGTGAKRWEKVLRASRLDAPADRQVPDDLDQALQEVVSLRHVLAHRAGRVDQKALNDAPTLRYADGDLVRITRDDYQCYSAAIRSYGQEIVWRLTRGLGVEGFDLGDWRGNYILGI